MVDYLLPSCTQIHAIYCLAAHERMLVGGGECLGQSTHYFVSPFFSKENGLTGLERIVCLFSQILSGVEIKEVECTCFDCKKYVNHLFRSIQEILNSLITKVKIDLWQAKHCGTTQ